MAGAQIASTALPMLFGNKNSGGSGIDTKSIKNTLDNYLKQINSAVETGRANVGASIAGMDKKIAKYTGELRNASDAETKAFWNNLGIFNDSLINSASALVNEYDGDVNKALNTLQTNIGKLNEGYAEDMGKEIERYGSVEDAINAQLASDKNVAETKFLDRVNKTQEEYKKSTFEEAQRTEDRSLQLGDRFLEQASAASQLYAKGREAAVDEIRGATRDVDATVEASRSLGFNTENAAAFGRLADTLSKAAQQTRADLLATADPRALELSAIADENASALMSGRISSDVQANLARTSAMRALQGGFAGGQMQRNMEARDLGLTSLDLQQRGTALYDAQRRLNYDTRVAGTQVNPFDVMQTNGLSTEQALGTATTNANRALDSARMRAGMMGDTAESIFRTSMSTAESDRNQRLGAIGEASAQRLQTFDRLFGANMGVADTLRGQDMELAGQLSSQRRDANIRSSGMRMAATQDIYNNMMGLSDTVFNTGMGLAGQKLSTGLSVAGDIYKTNVGGAGEVYKTRLGLENNIFGGRTDAAVAAMQAQAAYEQAALAAQAGAMGNAAATQANIPIMQAAQRQAGANASAQMWGSAFQAGSSLAGSYLGNANWNQGGRSFGGYSGFTNNPATGNPIGYASPTSYRLPGTSNWVG